MNELDRIQDIILNQLPQVVANTAVRYTENAFRVKAFDGKPWKKWSRNYRPGKGSLLVQSGKMARSVRARITPRKVTILAGKKQTPYAEVHNNGFSGSVVVRSHQRVRKGKVENVRSHTRNMNIPQRQFIGRCNELEKQIQKNTEQLFKQLLQ